MSCSYTNATKQLKTKDSLIFPVQLSLAQEKICQNMRSQEEAPMCLPIFTNNQQTPDHSSNHANIPVTSKTLKIKLWKEMKNKLHAAGLSLQDDLANGRIHPTFCDNITHPSPPDLYDEDIEVKARSYEGESVIPYLRVTLNITDKTCYCQEIFVNLVMAHFHQCHCQN